MHFKYNTRQSYFKLFVSKSIYGNRAEISLQGFRLLKIKYAFHDHLFLTKFDSAETKIMVDSDLLSWAMKAFLSKQ